MKLYSTLKTVLRSIALVCLCGSVLPAWAQVTHSQYTTNQGNPWDVNSTEMQQEPAAGVAVKAGRLFDPRSGTNLLNQVIIIKGGIIVNVGPAASVQIPAGARVLDLSSETVMPGLIDRHVHCFGGQPNDSRAALEGWATCMRDLHSGFTTIQDMGSSDTYAVVDVRDWIAGGRMMGPRMQVAGPQINPRAGRAYPHPDLPTPFGMGPGQPSWQNAGDVNSPWLARAAVREHAHYGTDWIKIYETEDYEGGGFPDVGGGAFRPDGSMITDPSLSLEETQAIVDEAHRHGIKTITHAYGGIGLRQALEGNIDVVMHMAVGVTGAEGLDDETIKLIKTPLPNGKQRPVIQTLWDLVGNMETEDLQSSHEHTTRYHLTELSFKRLVSNGVNEMFGSGVYALGHGTQNFQFPMYVAWGLTPAQAIKIATSNATDSLNYDWADKVGYVEKGRYADLSAVAGDPLSDITQMMKINFVMKGGVVFRNDLEPGAIAHPINIVSGRGRSTE